MAAESEAKPFGVIASGLPVIKNRILNFVSIAIPLAGTVFGIVTWPEYRPSIVTAVLFAAFFILTAVGIGVGLHRYFTHNAFKAKRSLRVFLAACGSFSCQGPIDRWVADHRRHHRYTDRPSDPHSPYYANRQAIASRTLGFLHSHIGWMLTGDVSDTGKYAQDIIADHISMWFSRTYWLWVTCSILLPAVIGFAFGGESEFVRSAIWAGCARIALLHNFTWAVNSIGHMFGTSVSNSRDQSKDNPVLAVLLLGEGLHNYHHRYPSAAINVPQALDANGWLISSLEKLGLVWDVRRFPR